MLGVSRSIGRIGRRVEVPPNPAVSGAVTAYRNNTLSRKPTIVLLGIQKSGRIEQTSRHPAQTKASDYRQRPVPTENPQSA